MLRRRDDIRILPGRWRWSETDEFPPWSEVKECPLLNPECAHYNAARAKLQKAVVQPEITSGGQYVTINIYQTQNMVVSQVVPGLGQETVVPMASPGGVQERKKAQSKTKPEKEAVREGIVHLVNMARTAAVPEDIQKLEFKLMVLECADDVLVGINPFLMRLLRQGVDLLLVGDPLSVTELVNTVETMCGQDLHCSKYTIHLHKPCTPRSTDTGTRLPSPLPDLLSGTFLMWECHATCKQSLL
jgi:hypothetical protein